MKHRNQKKKYFSLASAGRTADIFIFGDITSWEWLESDVSSYTLARAVQDLEADQINVHINSYGGEVAEGLAICNSLKNHPARVRTVCDGFACSAASVVFMAGDERVMNPASLLMVHNAWTNASGNARELRKAADDLDVITSASVETYKARVNLSDGELAALLDNETWITPADASDRASTRSACRKKSFTISFLRPSSPSQKVRYSAPWMWTMALFPARFTFRR